MPGQERVVELPQVDHAPRRARLRAAVVERSGGDEAVALVVTSPANVRWATGFTGTNGQLVVTPDRTLLVTDPRYVGRVATECPGLDVHVERDWVAAALTLAGEDGADRLLFEGEHVSHVRGAELAAAADDVGLHGCHSVVGIVEALRTVKDDAEIARIRTACEVTEQVLDAVLADGLTGRTERQVAHALEDGFRRAGAGVAFPSIVAGGPNGAVPHHEPTDRPLHPGELVTVDCGALVDGYHADTTRTVAVGRLPDDAELAEMFAHVAAAQQAGVAAAVVGATAGDVDAACREALHAVGLGELFVHGTGHGVGLEIHEAPLLAAGRTDSLAPGTTLTVEPGAYLQGRGGVRVEDTVVVTAQGPSRCTTSPHELRVH